jgi:hypothetical protein
MAIDFSKYFFWFLYSCSISESILTWVMLCETNSLCKSETDFLSYSSFWISCAVWWTESLNCLILLFW